MLVLLVHIGSLGYEHVDQLVEFRDMSDRILHLTCPKSAEVSGVKTKPRTPVTKTKSAALPSAASGRFKFSLETSENQAKLIGGPPFDPALKIAKIISIKRQLLGQNVRFTTPPVRGRGLRPH